jgi:hypothetical protein
MEIPEKQDKVMAIVTFRAYDKEQIEIWFAPTKEELSLASVKGRIFAICNTSIFLSVIYFNIQEA